MADNEMEALAAVDKALSRISDQAAKNRILKWAIDKHGTELKEETPRPETGNEIPGIAMLDADDKIHLTIRDIKAKSANDAAVRLALVAIRAHEKLTGQQEVSSRKVVVPILKGWRAYDGNTRVALADYRGIQRKGDLLYLDSHARTEADAIIREINDPQVKGNWTPKRQRGKSKRKAKSKVVKKKAKKVRSAQNK
ncbi:MAG: hypothetical protein GTO55_05965 [Armatimonadetes bacterium]|nr:hypothetical protein [Armatimonadota bacterium]NIM23800.1 hypothetical protein [Armatimonadota bacterium]NIM67677.1 hypothetical protein [Armatimonadota bacterium]NIN05878.1 hypothetical protein [Armatimonadota bacterium]NIO97247.1 hypothetical protein [Armatimonadota bacterium]